MHYTVCRACKHYDEAGMHHILSCWPIRNGVCPIGLLNSVNVPIRELDGSQDTCVCGQELLAYLKFSKRCEDC